MERRKRLLINPKFQLKFLSYMLLLLVGIIAITYSAQAYFFWKFTSLGHAINLPVNHVFFTFMQEQKSAMNIIFLVMSIAMALLVILAGLIISHRIAGPIKKICNQMRKTNVEAVNELVHFRKKDFFPELADSYNVHLNFVRDHSAHVISSPAEE